MRQQQRGKAKSNQGTNEATGELLLFIWKHSFQSHTWEILGCILKRKTVFPNGTTGKPQSIPSQTFKALEKHFKFSQDLG